MRNQSTEKVTWRDDLNVEKSSKVVKKIKV